MEDYHCYAEAPEIPMDILSQWDKQGIDPAPYREMLDSAKNALLAIRDIAIFFDEHDAAADAIARLFCCGVEIPDKTRKDVRNDILKELHIENVVVVR